MKTKLFYAALVAAALSGAGVQAEDNRTLGEKTSDTLEKAKDKTVQAGHVVAEDARKAANAVKDAVTPDSDARKVEVTLTEHHIAMPREIGPGKTAFVVRNSGKEKHNFRIEGQGGDKNFLADVDPNDTKTLHVDLKPGNYRVFIPGKTENHHEEIDLLVK